MKISNFGQNIWQAEEIVGPGIPLHVHLVKGPEYSVLVDSGLKTSFPMIEALLKEAEVAPGDVRIVFNTHAHHDHIGSNAALKKLTGCMVAAHPGAVSWIENHETNYLEFCCAFPEIFPDSPQLRHEILDTMDEPATRVDLRVRDGFILNLGNGIELEALEVPGHMHAELAFYERQSGTLLLGDAITGTDFPFFHGHLDVSAYRRSVSRLRGLRSANLINLALPAHYPPLAAPAFEKVLDKVEAYLDDIDSIILQILKETSNPQTLEQIWRELCQRKNKQLEWRGLAMTDAHLGELVAAGEIIYQPTTKLYRLKI